MDTFFLVLSALLNLLLFLWIMFDFPWNLYIKAPASISKLVLIQEIFSLHLYFGKREGGGQKKMARAHLGRL